MILRRMFMSTVTKDTLIGDILDIDEGTAPYFFEMGMHCLGCPSSRGESLEDACFVHGVDSDELVSKINEYLANK
jgi:hybrid cluster-associated redox disulfide protein